MERGIAGQEGPVFRKATHPVNCGEQGELQEPPAEVGSGSAPPASHQSAKPPPNHLEAHQGGDKLSLWVSWVGAAEFGPSALSVCLGALLRRHWGGLPSGSPVLSLALHLPSSSQREMLPSGRRPFMSCPQVDLPEGWNKNAELTIPEIANRPT